MHDLITSTELAAIVGVTRETVTRWVRRRWLVPAGQLRDGSYRFRREQVDEVLAGGSVAARAQHATIYVRAAAAKLEAARRRADR